MATTVLKSRALREKSQDELAAEAAAAGLRKSGSKEELVNELVRNSYPKYPLPKIRATSARGVVLGSFVSADGTIVAEGATDQEIVTKLLEQGRVQTEVGAKRAVRTYKHALERYWGYDLVSKDGERFVARKRK